MQATYLASRSGNEGARLYLPLGRRIAALRENQRPRMSQRELARRANISEGYIPRIERGLNRPDAQMLRDIATVLDADYEELAQLAGYLFRETTGETIIVPSEKAPVARRILRYPIDRLVEVERWLRILSTEPVPPQQEAKDGTGEETERPTGPDEPKPDSEYPATG